MLAYAFVRVYEEFGVPVYCWHPVEVQGELLEGDQEVDRRLLREHLDIGVSVSASEGEGE